MDTLTRKRPLQAAKTIAAADRIVLKIGSALLVDRKSNTVDMARLKGLAADIADCAASPFRNTACGVGPALNKL